MRAPRTAARRADRSAPLAPDLDAAGDFLDQWVGLTGAPHVTLVSIVPDGDRVRVRVGPLTAEVTAAAARELELAPGVTVVASFKATGARLVPLAG